MHGILVLKMKKNSIERRLGIHTINGSSMPLIFFQQIPNANNNFLTTPPLVHSPKKMLIYFSDLNAGLIIINISNLNNVTFQQFPHYITQSKIRYLYKIINPLSIGIGLTPQEDIAFLVVTALGMIIILETNGFTQINSIPCIFIMTSFD